MTLSNELGNISRIRRKPAAVSTTPTGDHVHDDSILHATINAGTVGNNTLIPAANKRIEILEMLVLNPSGVQTLIFFDSQNSTANILLRLLNYAEGAGLMLGFAGTGDPHFTIDAGNAFVLSLSVGTQVDGYIKYRLID
jgi:hypothetical protein